MQNNWYRLDTAALIFPAIARHDWSNAFRVSANLKEDVDPEILQQAVDELRPRFPSYHVALRKGVFWYYLEEGRPSLSGNGHGAARRRDGGEHHRHAGRGASAQTAASREDHYAGA